MLTPIFIVLSCSPELPRLAASKTLSRLAVTTPIADEWRAYRTNDVP